MYFLKKKKKSIVLSILLSPKPLGFWRPKYHLCHPSLNVVVVAIPLNAVAVHSSTRRRHIAAVGLP
jgi:hypothetical protein